MGQALQVWVTGTHNHGAAGLFLRVPGHAQAKEDRLLLAMHLPSGPDALGTVLEQLPETLTG